MKEIYWTLIFIIIYVLVCTLLIQNFRKWNLTFLIVVRKFYTWRLCVVAYKAIYILSPNTQGKTKLTPTIRLRENTLEDAPTGQHFLQTRACIKFTWISHLSVSYGQFVARNLHFTECESIKYSYSSYWIPANESWKEVLGDSK